MKRIIILLIAGFSLMGQNATAQTPKQVRTMWMNTLIFVMHHGYSHAEREMEKLRAENPEAAKYMESMGPSMFGNRMSLDSNMKMMYNAWHMSDQTVGSEYRALYDEFFGMEIMKEGVRKVKQHDMPAGYTPLYEEMSPAAMQKYIDAAVSTDFGGDDFDYTRQNEAWPSPVQAVATSFQWMESVSEKMDKDPEYLRVMERMSQMPGAAPGFGK